MYKQLSDVYLASAQAYAKLAEVEAIAIENKRVAEEAQAKVQELTEALQLKERHIESSAIKVADYERIYSIFMNSSVGDFVNIKNDVSNVEIEVEDDEVGHSEALKYQSTLVDLADDMLNIRIALGE